MSFLQQTTSTLWKTNIYTLKDFKHLFRLYWRIKFAVRKCLNECITKSFPITPCKIPMQCLLIKNYLFPAIVNVGKVIKQVSNLLYLECRRVLGESVRLQTVFKPYSPCKFNNSWYHWLLKRCQLWCGKRAGIFGSKMYNRWKFSSITNVIIIEEYFHRYRVRMEQTRESKIYIDILERQQSNNKNKANILQ